MPTWLIVTLSVLAGTVVGAVLTQLYAAASLAAVAAERRLLAERVEDLQASLAEDAETASALRPMGAALDRLEGKVSTLERDRLEQFGAVRSVMSRVAADTAELSRQTQALAGSLNASSVRGSWGEVQLKRVLEHAGMLARCDFEEQVSGTNRHGAGVRPDVVVRMPGGKSLVVDAKSPMSAFLQTQAEDVDPADVARLLSEHAKALRHHVSGLAAKDYWSAFDNAPEAVVCFVPSDAVLASALASDPSLYDAALAKRVVLVGPGALLTLLRAVAFTWQQESVATSARELLTVARELYDRLGTMGGHVSMMGRQLQRSVESYNQFVGTLENRVLPSARRMNDLGIGDQALPPLIPVQAGPRVLTAAELLDAVADPRPDLILPDLLLPHPKERPA